MAKRSTKMITLAANNAVRISEAQHEKLSRYIKDRLTFGNDNRNDQVDRFEIIAKEVAGFIILDEDDKKREQDNIEGKGPKVTDFNLALVLMQLDELVTYLLEVLVPDEGMYKAIAPLSKQAIAEGFAQLLNQQGDDFDHFGNYARGLVDAVTYNLGAWVIEWDLVTGNVFKNGQGNSFTVEEEIVKQGNNVSAIDIFNFLYDRSVPVSKLAEDGEFFATVDMKRTFRVKKDAADGKIFDIDRFIDNPAQQSERYYREHPEVFRDHSGRSGQTNWMHLLTTGSDVGEVTSAVEEVQIYMWINPREFGLSAVNEMQVWKFIYMNGQYIVSAKHLDNAHGMLPVAIAQPYYTDDTGQARSYAEYLLPLQRFASFQFNVHQRASRKALNGLTVYDRDALDIGPDQNMDGGLFPAKLPRTDKDVRKVLAHYTDSPDTGHTLSDIDNTMGLMQTLVPTDTTRQVASLERATKYQAAATVQSANRKNKKLAKLLNQSTFVPIRTMLMMNVMQFQEAVTIFDDSGAETEINPAQFRETDIRFAISEGLKGIDKLLVIELWNDIAQMILQSQQALTQLDIVALLDYITSIAGDKFDLKQFKFQHELDGQPPEVKDAALQALQQLQAEQEGQPS